MADEEIAIQQRMLTLVQRLIARTEESKIQWERTSSPTVFQTSFSDYVVRLSLREQDYVISIRDDQGAVLESATDVDINSAIPGSRAFDFMTRLYNMARRQAFGVDKALDSLLNELG